MKHDHALSDAEFYRMVLQLSVTILTIYILTGLCLRLAGVG